MPRFIMDVQVVQKKKKKKIFKRDASLQLDLNISKAQAFPTRSSRLYTRQTMEEGYHRKVENKNVRTQVFLVVPIALVS